MSVQALMTRRFVPICLCLAGAVALAACNDTSGCGGHTCPFADLAFAEIDGRVFNSDGSPHVADYREGVHVSVGPGTYGFSVPTDAAGRYRAVLDLPYDPGGETARVALSAGLPPFGDTVVTVPFSRDRSTRPTTTVVLRRRE
jgi:hypothetical protein